MILTFINTYFDVGSDLVLDCECSTVSGYCLRCQTGTFSAIVIYKLIEFKFSELTPGMCPAIL